MVVSPMPFVPPVTKAVFFCNPQKLGGGGGGTANSLLPDAPDARIADGKKASDWRRSSRRAIEVMVPNSWRCTERLKVLSIKLI